VNLATHKTAGIQAAIKTIDSRSSGSDQWRERIVEEVGTLKKLDHPNVMKVLDIIKNTGYANASAKTNEGQVDDKNSQAWDWTSQGIWKAHIVCELATGGDLFSYQESHGMLSEDESKFMAYQLVIGLDYLHSNNVAHRGTCLSILIIRPDDDN